MKLDRVLALALVLVVVIYFLNEKRDMFFIEEAKSIGKFVSAKLDDIDQVTIDRKELKPIQISYRNSKWGMDLPLQRELSAQQIQIFLEQIQSVRYEEEIKIENLDSTWLESFDSISFYKSKEEQVNLRVLQKKNFAGHSFVLFSSQKDSAFVITDLELSKLRFGLAYFLNKKVFLSDLEEIDRIEFKSTKFVKEGDAYYFYREKEKWEIPTASWAYFIEQLGQLEFQEALSWDEVKLEQKIQFGFDTPSRLAFDLLSATNEKKDRIWLSSKDAYKNFAYLEDRGIMVSGFSSSFSTLHWQIEDILGKNYLTRFEIPNIERVRCFVKGEERFFFFKDGFFVRDGAETGFRLKALSALMYGLEANRFLQKWNKTEESLIRIEFDSRKTTEFILDVWKQEGDYYISSSKIPFVAKIEKASESLIQQLTAMCSL